MDGFIRQLAMGEGMNDWNDEKLLYDLHLLISIIMVAERKNCLLTSSMVAGETDEKRVVKAAK